ncbi:hypothetical protein AB3S75_011957 [Citrus x aurantiifolia]
MQFWQVLIGLIMATQAERELYPNFVALAGVSCCGWLSWRRTVDLLHTTIYIVVFGHFWCQQMLSFKLYYFSFSTTSYSFDF